MSSTETATMSAMVSLLEAFARWQKEDWRLVPAREVDIRAMSNKLGIESLVHLTQPLLTPVPIAFIKTLSPVDVEKLPEDSRECGICTRQMSSLDDITDFKDDEVGLRLPCSHILGSKCLTKWFDPSQQPNNNTCPYCRAVCFAKSAPKHTIEGAQTRLNTVDWLLSRLGQEPDFGLKAEARELASNIFEYWLSEATKELERDRTKAIAEGQDPKAEPFCLRESFILTLNCCLVLQKMSENVEQLHEMGLGHGSVVDEEEEEENEHDEDEDSEAGDAEHAGGGEENEFVIEVIVDGEQVQPTETVESDGEEVDSP